MKGVTLYDINEFIRRVIKLNFMDPIWVKAEISQFKEVRGTVYIDLVDKNKDTIKAKGQAIIWERHFNRIKAELGAVYENILVQGNVILFKAEVEFNEKYGLKMHILDIDPTYTIGKLEEQRLLTIQTLKRSGLLRKNKVLNLPSVISRIALISTHRAAGYSDFIQHLQQNEFNYNFQVDLFENPMQGIGVVQTLIDNINLINKKPSKYDVVVIVRGGGAKLDLVQFDNLLLCKAIANCNLPVITGIGHEVDEVVADLVANVNIKTPTAVANFLVNRNLQFESELISSYNSILNLVQSIIESEDFELNHTFIRLINTTKLSIESEHGSIQLIETKLFAAITTLIEKESIWIKNNKARIKNLSLDATLKRGYSVLKKNNSIAEPSSIKAGDNLVIQTHEKQFLVTVNKILKNGKI